jgi:hypothetical protein
MDVKTFQDILKEFVNSLQAATVFPATIAVLMNCYFVLPCFIELDMASASSLVVITAAILALSYTFYAFNSPLIRLFEGYRIKYGRCLSKVFSEPLKKKQTKFKNLQNKIDELQEERLEPSVSFQKLRDIEVELSRLEGEYEFDYPASLEKVLPTRLGNAIAAFEDYSGKRYGMDAIALWPRLVPLLREKGHSSAVAQEKAVFDFMLYACVVFAGVGLELFCVNLYFGKAVKAVIVLTVFGFIAWVLYEGMIRAAKQWGQTVRTAFDLYRHHLYERLGLCEVESFTDEYDQWISISQFFLFRRNYRQFASLMTYKEVKEREKQSTN